MNKKTKIIASSAMAIALCASVATGGTFALFTSETKMNVAVTSATVNVTATADNLKLYSRDGVIVKDDFTIVNSGSYQDRTTYGSFANGGTATLSGDTLTITNITPGDKVTFDLVITNNSNIVVKYQTKLKEVSDNGLIEGLDISFEKDGTSSSFIAPTLSSSWDTFTAQGDVKTITVTIELPVEEGNGYQEKECEIAFTVKAVQGNAVVS